MDSDAVALFFLFMVCELSIILYITLFGDIHKRARKEIYLLFIFNQL